MFNFQSLFLIKILRKPMKHFLSFFVLASTSFFGCLQNSFAESLSPEAELIFNSPTIQYTLNGLMLEHNAKCLGPNLNSQKITSEDKKKNISVSKLNIQIFCYGCANNHEREFLVSINAMIVKQKKDNIDKTQPWIDSIEIFQGVDNAYTAKYNGCEK